MWDSFVALWQQGGFVMPPLALCCLLLWYFVGVRLVILRRGAGAVTQLVHDALERRVRGTGVLLEAARLGAEAAEEGASLERAWWPLYRELSRGAVIVKAVVVVSPLLGLLGTVAGMIETFASLGDMAMFARSGGISGGISQALVSTQVGLAVAIPGILAGRLLQRREMQLREQLDEMAAVFMALPAGRKEVA